MPISFIEAQRLLGEATGSYRLFTTTGAGSSTTLVCTGLQDVYLTDTSVPTNWVRPRSGIAAGEVRRLDGTFTFSTGTLTVTRAFSGAPGIDIVFELWTINPEDIINAIKRAVPKLAPAVHRKLVDTTTIVNNILDNPNFENPKTVLSFDGGGDADDLVTVSDDSTIQNIWDTGGTFEVKSTVYSDGESDLGYFINKDWIVGVREELNGYARINISMPHDSSAGVWVTTERCWQLGVPQILSIRHNVDDVANDPEVFVNGVREQLVPRTSPAGTRTTDSGTDLIFGNIAAATRTLDGTLHWIRLWNDWRTDREIQENLDSVLQGHELGLIGLWEFSVGSGATVFDLSVSQNNGAITSATWTAELPQWAQVNAPTVTVDRDRTFYGPHSVKVVAGASAGQLTQIPQINIALRAERTITAKAWCWTDTASQARVRLDWDGGTTLVSGDFHDGGSEWQLLSVSGAIPTTATTIKVILEVSANDTAYWGYAYLDVGAKAQYPLPMNFETLNKVAQQEHLNIPDGLYMSFADWQAPTGGRLLKLEGKGSVGVPGASEDVLDISGKQIEYLIELSKAEMYQTLQGRVEGTVKAAFIAERDDARASADILSRDRAVKSSAMGAETNKAWHIERNGTGMVLVFDNVPIDRGENN